MICCTKLLVRLVWRCVRVGGANGDTNIISHMDPEHRCDVALRRKKNSIDYRDLVDVMDTGGCAVQFRSGVV